MNSEIEFGDIISFEDNFGYQGEGVIIGKYYNRRSFKIKSYLVLLLNPDGTHGWSGKSFFNELRKPDPNSRTKLISQEQLNQISQTYNYIIDNEPFLYWVDIRDHNVETIDYSLKNTINAINKELNS